MLRYLGRVGLVAGVVGLAAAGIAFAAPDASERMAQALREHIVSMSPQTRVTRPDHERLSARRVDIVDADGVIRMSLQGDATEAIVDGIAYRRSVPMAGLLVFDESGGERGGIGVVSGEGGRTQLSFDYAANEGLGILVHEDGGTEIVLKAIAPEQRLPQFGDHVLPLAQGAERLRLRVSAAGDPEILLADAEERPRIRLGITGEGYGALEFLDAEGAVIASISPERDH